MLGSIPGNSGTLAVTSQHWADLGKANKTTLDGND